MDNKDKIIVPLDVNNIEAAKTLVKQLAPHVGAFKVGLELMNNCGAPQIVNELQVGDAKIFFDGKFNDIPNTVAAAARAVTRLGVWMFNVHALGGRAMMEAAREAVDYTSRASNVFKPIVLAVTILTSLDRAALQEVGLDVKDDNGLRDEVVRLARLAKDSGLDGVVASPKEIEPIREACGRDFLIVTPGVRPSWAASNDQKRVTTPAEAVRMGADYLVIGRPITKPPAEIGTSADAAKKIVDEIRSPLP